MGSLLGVAADGRKGLGADVVLDLTGVGFRRIPVYAQADQEIGEGPVPVQHLLGDGQAAGL